MIPALSNKKIVAATLFATSGALAYLIWKRSQVSKNVNHKYCDAANDPDLMDSFYIHVRSMCKDSFRQSRVILVETGEQWEEACKVMQEDLQTLKVMGMDCEWITKDKKRSPVSMLQLSTLNCTALIRTHILEAVQSIPQSLIDIIENKNIFKVGVGALEDRNKLMYDYGINMVGCVDLRHMAGRHRKSWNGGGLKKLAEEIAGIPLDKSDKLRRGDWEAESLSKDMQSYAAGDSQAGLAIFLCLVALKLQSSKHINSEYTDQVLTTLQKRSVPMCHGITDLPYKLNPVKERSSSANNLKPWVPSKGPPKTISSNALRQRAMYSNCVMQAPDGQVLCVCDVKKAEWYCEKELADKVSEDDAEEMVIRLRFEPRGRPSGERDYYRSRKENICVVCGADKSFIRKNIVPREYRKHFPEILKSHSSHDVVLLCASCHKKSGSFDQMYKEYFAKECSAPYKSGGVTVDSDLKRVKSAARTLHGYADRITAEKLAECKQILCQFYGTQEITDDVLESACNLEDRSSEPHEHGFLVVQHFLDNSSIQEFQRLWRLRFVEKMCPQHLGEYWHVDYNHLDYLWVKDGDDEEGRGGVQELEASTGSSEIEDN